MILGTLASTLGESSHWPRALEHLKVQDFPLRSLTSGSCTPKRAQFTLMHLTALNALTARNAHVVRLSKLMVV